MTDPRIETLARNLIGFSCNVQRGENVLIETYGDCDALLLALIRETYAAGAKPFVWRRDNAVQRAIAMGAADAQLDLMARVDKELMENMQAYIGIRGGNNNAEMSDVPAAQRERMSRRYSNPVHSEIRVPKTKWCVMRYPSPGMAQMANLSTEAFEDYYFNVCNLDYSKMDRAMDPLKALMEKRTWCASWGRGQTFPFHQRPAGDQVRGRMQYPGWRNLYRAGAGQHQRRALLQYAVGV